MYIAVCADGSLYTGWTYDLKKRIARHNEGKGSRYTRSRLPVTLSYSEECESKSQALRRESEIKKLTRQGKLGLIGTQKV